jgi:hypothetical protein
MWFISFLIAPHSRAQISCGTREQINLLFKIIKKFVNTGLVIIATLRLGKILKIRLSCDKTPRSWAFLETPKESFVL